MNGKHNERGITLVETMVAMFIALLGVFSLGTVIFEASVINKNQGTENTRATIYAQDKIESMLALDFAACSQSSTSQPASCNTTGISASGWTQGLLTGGAIAPVQTSCPESGPQIGYIDFLDGAGQRITGASCSAVDGAPFAYIRQWRVVDLATSGPALKQVTVAVYSQSALATLGGKPVAVLTSVVSNPN
ncbi:MAG: prepilin-type N-terminal cleavage/methylation domain-containing protein [Terriglobia bacterium]